MEIRSISFDTSFLLKDDPDVDKVIKILKRDRVPCFITGTVISEIKKLKVHGRIDQETYEKATKRWKRAYSKIIDYNNKFMSAAITKDCTTSMEKHHGVDVKDILNDCNIIVTGLKNGVNVFLSEDYHFTSEVTDKVLKDIQSGACSEYRQMCSRDLYSIDTKTFLEAYDKGKIDLEIIMARKINIKKPGKRIK